MPLFTFGHLCVSTRQRYDHLQRCEDHLAEAHVQTAIALAQLDEARETVRLLTDLAGEAFVREAARNLGRSL